MFKGMHAAMLAVALLGASASVVAASPIAGRVEEELLSDGISLARLSQRLELREHGSALDVVLLDRATGAVVATRTVDKLPAEPAAAVAQLTMVVSSMLRERGLVPAAAGGDWQTTFASATVVAYHRPASVAVIAIDKPGRMGDATKGAAAALVSAYRAAGVAIQEVASLGAVADGDDAEIVARAKSLSAEKVVIVRGFAEGPTSRAVVTLYDANGQLVTGFSAVAGQALQAPVAATAAAPSSPVDDSVADRLMRTKVEPAMTKDGQVRLWIKQKDPMLQLMGGSRGIVCRAPCGEVIDGSLGEVFLFAHGGRLATDPFQVIGHKGDVTADVKPSRLGLRLAGSTFLWSGITAAGLGAIAVSDSDKRGVGVAAIGGGVAAAVIGYLMQRAGSSRVILTDGRPK